MPKQAKGNPVPRTKTQNKESGDRDRAVTRELKGIFARVNDPKPKPKPEPAPKADLTLFAMFAAWCADVDSVPFPHFSAPEATR